MKIVVKNINKSFKNIEVLNDVNCIFESGKIYGLYGPNGSGKTVLLKILCGFYKPNSGEVLYDSKSIFKEDIYAPDTRALIENPSFIGEYTAYENLKVLADIQKTIGEKQILDCMAELKLLNIKDKKVSSLSLGYKQRLGLAQVLMENPMVIILDEPFNGMDEESFTDFKEILQKRKQEGKVIIISSHMKAELFNISDVIYKFQNGNVVAKRK